MHFARKNGFRVLLVMLGFAAFSARADTALTADELAAHLGVQHWETVIEPPAGSEVTVFMSTVKNGKITPASFSVTFIAAPVYHTAVMVSRSGDGLKATVTAEGGTLSYKLEGNPPSALGPLPSKITSTGDYVLGGDYHEKNNNVVMTGKAADIEKNGLVFHVEIGPKTTK